MSKRATAVALGSVVTFLCVPSTARQLPPTTLPAFDGPLGARVNVWSTDHGDNYNLGFGPGAGPGSSPAYCRKQWVAGGGGAAFSSSGVTSTVTSSYNSAYVADDSGLLWIITDEGNNVVRSKTVNLASTFGVTSASGLTGAYAPPVALFDSSSNGDVVIQPSVDGYVYAVSQVHCAIAAAAEAVSTCGVWAFRSPLNNAFSNAPRLSSSQDVVYVAEMDPLLNGNGWLRALNVSTGTESVWPAPFKLEYPSGSGNAYPLLGVTPALNPLPSPDPNAHLIIPVGPALLLLDASTGLVITSIDTLQQRDTCPGTKEVFASSVAVLDEGDKASLYVQTTKGSLFSYTLALNGGNWTFACSWACSFEYQGDGAPPLCVTDPPAHEVSHVGGGWPTVTTVDQRDALHAAVRDAHAALYGAEAGAAISARDGVGAVVSGHVMSEATREVSALARQLPPSLLLSLLEGTPHAGYVRRGRGGKPVSEGDSLATTWGGDFLVSTPAINGDGSLAAFATYAPLSNNDLGVLAVSTLTGVTSAFWNSAGTDANNAPLKYARSRSSPAWDVNNVLYLTADFDWTPISGVPGANDTVPALVVLGGLTTGTPSLLWALDLGQELGGSIGSTSPVLSDGTGASVHRVLVASTGGAYNAVSGCGNKCPSGNPLLECSGHGKCDGNSGNCTCVPSWNSPTDDTCQTNVGCGRGKVQGDGSCVCAACWEASALGTCTKALNCLNGGYCEVVNASSTCRCPTCNTPSPLTGLCTSPYTGCGPNSTGCDVDTCICGPCSQTSDDGLTCVPRSCGSGTCDTTTNANGTCLCDTCFSTDTDTGACTVEKNCGQGGVCSVAEGGTCESDGDNCWLFNKVTQAYDTYQTCAGHGYCRDVTGLCTCDPGWNPSSIPTPCGACDACHSGLGTCSVLNTCSGHGVCTLGATPSIRVCTCAAGWSGVLCEEALPPPDATPSRGGGVDPVLAAGVGVPVALLGAAAAGFLLRRRTGAYAKMGSGSGGGGGKGAPTSSYQSASSSSAAPQSFAGIAKSAGFDSDAAKAAVSRLGVVKDWEGGAAGAAPSRASAGKGPSSSSSLLAAARSTAKVPKGSYGGL